MCIETETAHIEDATAHRVPAVSQTEHVTAHTEAVTAHTTPEIVPIAATKSYKEAVTAHMHPFEPTATNHEKMTKLFFYYSKGCLLTRIHIDY